MKVDQVIRLLEAGYSKEEIQQMDQWNSVSVKVYTHPTVPKYSTPLYTFALFIVSSISQ